MVGMLALVLVVGLPQEGGMNRAEGSWASAGDTIPGSLTAGSRAVRPEPRVRFDAALAPRFPGSRGIGSPARVGPAGAPAARWPVSPVPPMVAMVADTPAPPPLIEYTDAYYTRLQIHKWASWAMLPMFALQYASGQQMVDNGGEAPGWARDVHGPAAAGVAALFGVNTVTGVWNLWDARQDPYGRGWRNAHGILMLLADAGFVATGMLAEEAEEGGSANTHRTVALTSMGVAVVSWVMMLPPFRRD